MTFEVQRAQPADGLLLADAFFASFNDKYNSTLFPRAADTHEWFSKGFFGEAIADDLTGDGHMTVLKVVETSNPSVIAAFAIWKRYTTSADRDRRDKASNSPVQLPPSSDKALCDRFFGLMEVEHTKWMGDRPHYYLEMLGCHELYRGRGLASKLLHWGLARAEGEGVELFLSASPQGKPIYAKYGFRAVNANTLDLGYELTSMIWTPKKEGELGNIVP